MPQMKNNPLQRRAVGRRIPANAPKQIDGVEPEDDENNDDDPIVEQETRITKRPEVALNGSHKSVPMALLSSTSGADLTRIIKDNLGVGQLQLTDLTRIKMPSGGALTFQIPSLAGKPKSAESIDGVIIAHTMGKSFWVEPLSKSGGGNPPDCMSHDMIHGLGDPSFESEDQYPDKDTKGWLCETCYWNQFGSAENGDGKACKDLRFVFFMEGRSKLPKVMIVPPTSLKSFKQYMLGLVNEDLSVFHVVTRFQLIPDKNNAGIEYAKLVPVLVAELSDEEKEAASRLHDVFAPLVKQVASQTLGTDVDNE